MLARCSNCWAGVEIQPSSLRASCAGCGVDAPVTGRAETAHGNPQIVPIVVNSLLGTRLVAAFLIPGSGVGAFFGYRAWASSGSVGGLIALVVCAALGAIALVLGVRDMVAEARQNRVLAGPLLGKGRILDVKIEQAPDEADTYHFSLEVELPGEAPYTARKEVYVPADLKRRVAVDTRLPIRVDPSDRRLVVIEWQVFAVQPQPSAAREEARASPGGEPARRPPRP